LAISIQGEPSSQGFEASRISNTEVPCGRPTNRWQARSAFLPHAPEGFGLPQAIPRPSSCRRAWTVFHWPRN
jgi:hypothetical protein